MELDEYKDDEYKDFLLCEIMKILGRKYSVTANSTIYLKTRVKNALSHFSEEDLEALYAMLFTLT